MLTPTAKWVNCDRRRPEPQRNQFRGLQAISCQWPRPPADCLPVYGGCQRTEPAPAGSVPIGAVSICAPAFENFENFVQSIDYNISSRDQFRGRYVYNKLDEIDHTLRTCRLLHHPAFPLPSVHSRRVPHFLALRAQRVPRGLQSLCQHHCRDGGFTYPGLDSFPNITF